MDYPHIHSPYYYEKGNKTCKDMRIKLPLRGMLVTYLYAADGEDRYKKQDPINSK